jgi:putative tricarboxylic transport membrane protein
MSDRILGAVCIVASASMAWATRDYAAAISYEPVGPRAFPLVLSGLMAIGGLWLVVQPSIRSGAFEGVPVKQTALCVLAVLIYALLFETLGFTLATALMAIPVGIAFGGSWKQVAVTGVGLGLILYFLFDKLLDIVLPTGLLSFVLGGR